VTSRNRTALNNHPLYRESRIRSQLISAIPIGQLERKVTLPLVYIIWRKDEAGLLASLATVLRGLEVARWLGATPVVDMKNFFTAYSGDMIQTRSNLWTQLFAPIGKIDVDEIRENEHRVLFSDGVQAEKSIVDNEPLLSYRREFFEHIRYSEETAAWIAERTRGLRLGGDVIGVHYRGGDMRTAPRHSLPPTATQLIRRVSTLLDGGDYNSVFLATNVKNGATLFRKAFGTRVSFLKADEASPPASDGPFGLAKRLGQSFGFPAGASGLDSVKNGLQFARDVLSDVEALSRCGALVCGDSNVTLMARVFSKSGFREVLVVDNGRNATSRFVAYTQWYIRANLPAGLGGFGR
jgi:hypothetical protein